MLDLRQLNYFVAVAETENGAHAAARLGISQSPLSRQIMQLEAHLGLALFERSRQRVHLTSEGRLFLQKHAPFWPRPDVSRPRRGALDEARAVS
jgi:DNA-binding transcriptional LysR family regulator